MINIAIITSGKLPIPAVQGGGVETLVERIIRENEKYHEFDVDLYTMSDPLAIKKQAEFMYTRFINIRTNEIFNKAVQIINALIYSINRRTLNLDLLGVNYPYNCKVAKIVKSKKYDIVLIESNKDIIRLFKRSQHKVIYHSHYDDLHPQLKGLPLRIAIKQFECAHYFISISNFISNRIKSILGDNHIYFTLHNSINLENYSKENTENIQKIKNKYNIGETDCVIMYCGRITPEKGVKELVEAFSSITNDNLALLIVGSSFYNQYTSSNFVKELKIMAERSFNPIIFTGYIPQNSISDYWHMSNIGVVPTTDVEEAAGLVVLEAMAAGKPLIISDSGAMREYVSSQGAIVVERECDMKEKLRNALLKLSKDKDLRISMGNINRIDAQLYSAKNYYLSFCKIVKKILAFNNI